MKTATLNRIYLPDCTAGTLVSVNDGHALILSTIELPWLDNRTQISCIPAGDYLVKFRRTEKFGDHYHIQDVPGRGGILFHTGNYTRQIRGCILPGMFHRDLDKDGVTDIGASRIGLDKMLAWFGKENWMLTIQPAP